jgi:probable F420-dependent oxidoreductase
MDVLAPTHQERRALRKALGRVGVWSFTLETQPAEAERSAAAEIERLGYRAIWFPEAVASKEAFSHAALLLSSTERVVVATGIANIWARDAVAMANGWRTLTDAWPNRFLLGIGVSHAGSVDRRGSRYTRPYSRLREYLNTIESAPSSAPRPAASPWLVLAALGPRMLDLAAERALGAHPYFVPVEHTAFARARLGPEPVLAVEQTAVLETDPAMARRIARMFAADYLASPNYANNLRRLGWTEADVTGQGSDRLIDAVVVWGDVDAIRRRVKEHLDAGADHVCVQVVTVDETEVGLSQLRALAPALLS